MSLHDYLSALAKHWIAILVCAVLGAVCGFAYARSQTPVYQAHASVIVVPEQGQNSAELVQGSNYVDNLVASYAVLATSPYVLQPVIDDLGLDDTPSSLRQRVTVDTPLDTVILQISVSDESADRARETADAITKELTTAIPKLSPQLASDSPAVRVSTISPARQPLYPISPNTRLLILEGFALGALLGCAYAVVRRTLAQRVTSASAIESQVVTPILGKIIRTPRGTTLPAAIVGHPGGRAAESLRTLVANLRFADLEAVNRVILVSSGDSAEGKSSVATSLALTLAEDDSRVLLIDADLRRPSVARLTGIEQAAGLTNVLIGDVSPREVLQPWVRPNLLVLPSGDIPPNPGALLASSKLTDTLAALRKNYDYVIIDSAPLLPLSDPLWLGQNVDGILVVARAGKTRVARLEQTITGFDRSGARVLGIALNGVAAKGRNAYYGERHAHQSILNRIRPGADEVEAGVR